MSANTESYWKKIQDLESNPVAAYQSKYQAALDNVLNQIQNRKEFSYDFNADPMYQMYKDQYTKLGNEAAQNAVAATSALTGGYGNSYATTAGAQANQQYLTKLNEMIPDLYNLALNRYKMEGDQLKDKYSVLGDAEDRDYGRHRDTVGDWKDQLAYLQSAYGTQLANDQWRAELDEKIREFDLEYALKNRPMYGGGGGGGTKIVYVNGKPVEVNDNNSGTKEDLAALAADTFNNRKPRSQTTTALNKAVDEETARIANQMGITDTNQLRHEILNDALKKSGYFN